MLSLSIFGCGDNGDPSSPPHSHLFSTAWSYNETQHWHACACGDRADVANHTFIGDDCTVCYYNRITNDDQNAPKTLVITGITAEQIVQFQDADNAFFIIFPPGTSEANVIADFMAISTENLPNYGIAGNGGNNIEPPAQVTPPFNVIVPLLNLDQTPWKGTGTFDVYEAISGKVKMSLIKFGTVTITSAVTTVLASNMEVVYEENIPHINGTISLVNIPSGNPRIWVNIRGRKDDLVSLWWNDGAGENEADYSKGTTNIPWVAHTKNFVWNTGSGVFFPATLEFFVYAIYNNNEMDTRNKGVYVSTGLRFETLEDAMGTSVDLGIVDFDDGFYWPGE